MLEGKEQRKEKMQKERVLPPFMDMTSMGPMFQRPMSDFQQMRGYPRQQMRFPGRGRGRGMPRPRMSAPFREMMPPMAPRQMMYMQPSYPRMPMMNPMGMQGNMPMQMMGPQMPGMQQMMMPPQGMMPMAPQNLMGMQGMIRIPEQMQGMMPGQMPMQPAPQAPMQIRLPTDREELGEIIYNKIMQMTGNESETSKITGMLLELSHEEVTELFNCLLYTSPSPRDLYTSRMPSSA
eukprot:TRINITY_DN3745_c0_g1_i1.p1 TRINITY_DN3745_c0_g1~~TRINITY_DN3745_c0_g1_i1.p1  ORF type:complete len:235 (-),score=80.85 TRINITY_DN3745_c0_g1_i1:9-713(-)